MAPILSRIGPKGEEKAEDLLGRIALTMEAIEVIAEGSRSPSANPCGRGEAGAVVLFRGDKGPP